MKEIKNGTACESIARNLQTFKFRPKNQVAAKQYHIIYHANLTKLISLFLFFKKKEKEKSLVSFQN